jgi:hypothetical protein
MSIQVKIESVDKSSQIVWDSLEVEQILTSQVDTAKFSYRKVGARSYVPDVQDEVEIYDGAVKIFGGYVSKIAEKVESGADGLIYDIDCVDYSSDLDGALVGATYENKTVAYIINDLITNYCPTFTVVGVTSTYVISKIVFNQISVAACIKKIADLLKYEWYVDVDKDVKFFSSFTYSAPYDLTDTSGNFVYNTLERDIDGTQITNQVKVRGSLGTETTIYTDVITVKGNDTMSFSLPFKFQNLGIRVDAGAGYVAKSVGIQFIDTFATKDVLYNYNDDSIAFASALSDGNKIEYSGNRKYPVLAVASDPVSIAAYGLKEKLIRDNSIADGAIARKRAQAEILTYKDEISDAKFDTFTAGLRTGMVMNINSTLRNFNLDFIITRVVFKPYTPMEYAYSVELVTTRRYGFIELLQKLIAPEDMNANEAEVAEIIKTDVVTVSIDELIQTVAAIPDLAVAVLLEVIYKDPLGAGVEPIWVLSYYFPTGMTVGAPIGTAVIGTTFMVSGVDNKRAGRLDYSLKFY